MSRDRIWERAMELGAAGGCHQMPERSFFIGDYQFPVCARCTGVLIGQAAAFAALVLRKNAPAWSAAAMLAVMGADWGAQRVGICESTNIRRLITGIAGGMGVIFLYAAAVRGLVKAIKMAGKG